MKLTEQTYLCLFAITTCVLVYLLWYKMG